jgi:hypothetical protein
MRLGIAAVVALFTLAVPGVAAGQGITITPTRFDDPAPGPVGCPTDCSLRQAVAAVGGAQPVTISLKPGRYDLTQGVPLVLQSADVVTINGAGARVTTIHGNNLGSVFDLEEGSDTTINDVTITGGNSAAGQDPDIQGGAVRIDVAGRFELNRSAILGNRASTQGGGISSFSNSPVLITDSVIAGNIAGNVEAPAALGGGIYSTSQLTLRNTTVSGNQLLGTTTLGAGVYATGAIDLAHVTIAGNSAPAARGTSLQLQAAAPPPPTSIWNTIVTAEVGAACAINRPTTGDHNLDDDSTCAFMRPGDRPGVNPLLGPLANNGGPTDTRALSAGSPAIDGADATHCQVTDQRGVARPQAGACDIGAFEYVPPPPTQPTQPSQPPPDDEELPPPVAGKTVNALLKSGRVRIRLPKTDKFVRLQEGQQVPVGTVFDTRNGHVTLVAAANRQGGTATSEFWAGIFRLGQNRKARPTTTLTLTEKLRCPKAGSATTAAKRMKKRRLWGNGSGKFRTKGKHSAATVVGTKWLVEDRCKATLTRVVRGRVSVRDFVKKRTVIVRAGKRYTARAG